MKPAERAKRVNLSAGVGTARVEIEREIESAVKAERERCVVLVRSLCAAIIPTGLTAPAKSALEALARSMEGAA